MKNEGWSTFSFTEALSPPEGWRTDCAILSTYSADLVVIVMALLALTGCDLDDRKGSRVELVKAIEALRGRVRILAQTGRVPIPRPPRPILKLLDKFLRTIDTDENVSSWHPKIALVRFHNLEDITERQWRVWLGSRNLTRALNWEAGMTLMSRSDGKGQRIDGLVTMAETLALRADLPMLPRSVGEELSKLTWECPSGCEVKLINLLGPNLCKGLPKLPSDIERMFVVSPFLDASTIRAASRWGNAKTRRTLVSTAMELQRLWQEDRNVFASFEHTLIQPFPELPAEYAATREEEGSDAVETAESEELPPAGLHAKLLFAAKGTRRQLWLGSANATERGWDGRNFEVVAEMSISRDTADGIDEFVGACETFNPNTVPVQLNEDEEALERARKLLSRWSLRQHIGDDNVQVISSEPPPLGDAAITLEVALLGGTWRAWPLNLERVSLPGSVWRQRSDFIQLRISRGDRTCAWVQIAPCDIPPDEHRDHALIAQYLDPRTFLLWVRSILSEETGTAGGGDWDAEVSMPFGAADDRHVTEIETMPSVEEILRCWARDTSSFVNADEKVKSYLSELERRADDNGATQDADLLKKFRHTWESLALELL